MTKFKRIVAIALSLAVFCSLCVTFSGCIDLEEVQRKQRQIDELQAQLDSQQKEIDEIKAQLESKQKEVDELKRDNDSSTYRIGNLKKDIKTLVGKLSGLMEQDLETLSKDDEDLLKYDREPSLEENFQDNAVSVILKSRFVGLVGFDDFAITKKVSEVIAIKYGLETIYKGSDDKFPIYEGYNEILTLTLSTHDKQKVLEVAEILRKLDMVLIAHPAYIYTTLPCSVPSDTYYSAQWGLKGDYGINIEGAV